MGFRFVVRELRRGSVRVLAVGTLAVLLTMRIYWGYWIVPPDVDSIVQPIASIERFSAFELQIPFDAPPRPLPGPTALEREAQKRLGAAGEDPMPRVCKALIAAGLVPSSTEPIERSEFDAVVATLFEAGRLSTKHIGTFHFLGSPILHLAHGRDRDGREIYVTASVGTELSNDHFDYCEALLERKADGSLAIVAANSFEFDRCGMEGFAHWWVGALAALAAAAVQALFWVARALDRFAHRVSPLPPAPSP
ncbi:MAG: hypothetical protein IPH13_08335 [Planctomycetes bacterium]|nr:hypothetical protein [Planctomycetota bacterium]